MGKLRQSRVYPESDRPIQIILRPRLAVFSWNWRNIQKFGPVHLRTSEPSDYEPSDQWLVTLVSTRCHRPSAASRYWLHRRRRGLDAIKPTSGEHRKDRIPVVYIGPPSAPTASWSACCRYRPALCFRQSASCVSLASTWTLTCRCGLRMTLSGYFMLKSVFQGCRTLTFALARLSCTI